MKPLLRFSLLILILLSVTASAFSQLPYARRVYPVAALPATCNPLNGEIVFLTIGAGISPGAYSCNAVNTWFPAGTMGNQFVLLQGALIGSFPFINHTATWNNGAVTFVDHFVNITDTASNAASLLMQLEVGGANKFTISKGGVVTTAGNVVIPGTSEFLFNARSAILSGADGQINLTSNAGAAITRFTFGAEAVAYPAIQPSPTVAGQAQGIIFVKGDGTNYVFANLGAATNGSFLYCNDCAVGAACAGAGTGAALDMAKRGGFDLVLVHARALEDKFIADGFGIGRRDVMYNDFVILGPAADPVGMQGEKQATAALEKIVRAQTLFVTRGDNSGTHVKEKELWEKLGIKPGGPLVCDLRAGG